MIGYGWRENDTAATSDVTIYDSWMSDDDNSESLHLFLAPIVLLKKDKKSSKWLQKVIKSRGKR